MLGLVQAGETPLDAASKAGRTDLQQLLSRTAQFGTSSLGAESSLGPSAPDLDTESNALLLPELVSLKGKKPAN
jgi:hypothetical protein